MANELLDFVMALVRDPEAATRYAADPAQAIADAHLTDVTSADVNNLIPMVSDSLSMAAPAFGADTAIDDVVDSNVWTSGAATAAFDAFAPLPPVDLGAHGTDIGGVIDTADPAPIEVPSAFAESTSDSGSLLTEESDLLSDVDIDALSDAQPGWDDSATDPGPVDHGHAGFDLFD
ncbi:Rv0340 family IniB-related protein [Mycolicibacterium mengxianglii]|uniref:Rv0340 family IniB-related protein n=1 Tax=Mycolicibacterium mengxianglii TaxID=2736649 RepID=UPI0018D145F7|nr:Rv0340 family IniB-related protein [Mycolicibacterium mengxianglii]